MQQTGFLISSISWAETVTVNGVHRSAAFYVDPHHEGLWAPYNGAAREDVPVFERQRLDDLGICSLWLSSEFDEIRLIELNNK